MVQSYKDIKYILGKGSGASYNAGIDAGNGELITFLDYDDFWKKNKLTVQLNYLYQHPEIEYVIAKMRYFLEPGCNIPPGCRE
ncbi:MAG: glycosyltransferase family 2 protein [Okeania sp. SIO2C2]|nr:glycosyltransferase family 2 protein [Okeania sp. SIO2C2]